MENNFDFVKNRLEQLINATVIMRLEDNLKIDYVTIYNQLNEYIEVRKSSIKSELERIKKEIGEFSIAFVSQSANLNTLNDIQRVLKNLFRDNQSENFNPDLRLLLRSIPSENQENAKNTALHFLGDYHQIMDYEKGNIIDILQFVSKLKTQESKKAEMILSQIP